MPSGKSPWTMTSRRQGYSPKSRVKVSMALPGLVQDMRRPIKLQAAVIHHGVGEGVHGQRNAALELLLAQDEVFAEA